MKFSKEPNSNYMASTIKINTNLYLIKPRLLIRLIECIEHKLNSKFYGLSLNNMKINVGFTTWILHREGLVDMTPTCT